MDGERVRVVIFNNRFLHVQRSSSAQERSSPCPRRQAFVDLGKTTAKQMHSTGSWGQHDSSSDHKRIVWHNSPTPEICRLACFLVYVCDKPSCGNKALSAISSQKPTPRPWEHPTPLASQRGNGIKTTEITAWRRKQGPGDTKRDSPLLDEHVRPQQHGLFQQTRPRAAEQFCHVNGTLAGVSVAVFELYSSSARRVFPAQRWMCDGHSRYEIECVVPGSAELDKGVGNGRHRQWLSEWGRRRRSHRGRGRRGGRSGEEKRL